MKFAVGDKVKLNKLGRIRRADLPQSPHNEVGRVAEVAGTMVMVQWPNGAGTHGERHLQMGE